MYQTLNFVKLSFEMLVSIFYLYQSFYTADAVGTVHCNMRLFGHVTRWSLPAL